jgi:hypothetical protein
MKTFGRFSWSEDRLSSMQLGNCDLEKIISQVIPLNIVFFEEMIAYFIQPEPSLLFSQ